ncbi:MAG: Electron transfer flavoprotein subunit beta [Syntrophorhabdus sp. PtaU1.Bin050]|nr:MAG: Electron transfer flavoprotein subunit beta [Syntrophorhabdus sp. PtaU1.Bin050]
MNIVVCAKQVVDSEAPPVNFRVDEAKKKGEMVGISQVLDPYGEYALEAALRLKAANGGKVTVITMGTGLVPDVVKKSLAMGADELILLEDSVFEDVDGYGTAYGLSLAIKKLGAYDLILTGREASDTNGGQTGSGIAEILGLPCVTLAKQIDIDGSQAKVQRMITDGYEVATVPLPAVITVSNEIGEVRYPTVKGIMAAKKIKPTVYGAADLGLDVSAHRKSNVIRLFQEVQEAHCEFIQGETPEEMADKLAEMLRTAKIL